MKKAGKNRMFACKETPIGKIGIESDGKHIVALHLRCDCKGESSADPLIAEAFRQLGEYFAGNRRTFDLPLKPAGTPFQLRVWEALRRIPCGKTATYGEIAAAVGCPKGPRAVGMANNRNPIAIFIPCHRVIGADGKLVGYAGGLDVKRRLLDLEAGVDAPR